MAQLYYNLVNFVLLHFNIVPCTTKVNIITQIVLGVELNLKIKIIIKLIQGFVFTPWDNLGPNIRKRHFSSKLRRSIQKSSIKLWGYSSYGGDKYLMNLAKMSVATTTFQGPFPRLEGERRGPGNE